MATFASPEDVLVEDLRTSARVQDRDAGEDEKQFKLSRFMPVLQEVLEDLATNALPEHEYPYVSAPTSNGGAACCALYPQPSLITVAARCITVRLAMLYT